LPVLIGDKAFEFVHFGCVGRGYNIWIFTLCVRGMF